ncbi:MAG: MarR family transcriptional regulator [Pseudomonadota bacterium]
MDIIDQLLADWDKERPDLDPSAMAVVGRLLNIGQRLENRITERLKPYGLNYSDFDVLATLRRSGSPYELTPKALMQSVLLTSGAMTALLERLEKRELITRGTDEKDRRVRTAKLTHQGKDIVDQAIGERFDEAREAISFMTKDDQDKLAKTLSLLTSHLT